MKKKKGDYYKWKEGKKVFKAPWVIDHYKSVTDENQYDKARKSETIAILVFGIVCFIFGVWFGFIMYS